MSMADGLYLFAMTYILGTMKVKVFSGNDDVLADGFTLVSKNGGRQYVVNIFSKKHKFIMFFL